jgi:hypothetical protein
MVVTTLLVSELKILYPFYWELKIHVPACLKVKNSMFLGFIVKNAMYFLVSEWKTQCTRRADSEKTLCVLLCLTVNHHHVPAGYRVKIFMQPLFNSDSVLIPSFVHCVLCIVHCALCIVYCALCIVHCVLCIVHCVLCIVHCVLCTVHCVLCIVHCLLCIVCCALCIVHCALCIVYCALYIVHCVLCIVHCVLCIVYCALCMVHCVLCIVYYVL